MPDAALTALLTAAAPTFATLVAFILGMHRLRLDREKQTEEQKKLAAEIEKLHLESKHLRNGMNESRLQESKYAEALIAIETQKLQELSSKRNQIYPQLLEIVYRLRNELRTATDAARNSLSKATLVEDNS